MNAPSPVAGSQRVKLTIDDYLLLDRSGALAGYGRTELVDGAIYALSPQHLPHAYAKSELAYRLRRALEALRSPLYVLTEGSVTMPPHAMPMPDITLTSVYRGEGAITVASVALIVEVSSTSLAFDRDEKAPLYASAGVPEYWIVDLGGRTLHQMSSPSANGYAERREVMLGERIHAMTVDGLSVETDDLT